MNIDVDKFLAEHPEAAAKPVTWGQLLTLFKNAKVTADKDFEAVLNRLIVHTAHLMELPEDHGGAAP